MLDQFWKESCGYLKSAGRRKRSTDRLTAIVAVILFADGVFMMIVALFQYLPGYAISVVSMFIAAIVLMPTGLSLWFDEEYNTWNIHIGGSILMSLYGLIVCVVDSTHGGTEHLILFVPLLLIPIFCGIVYWSRQSRHSP
ncbi:MAG: hypothetical protein EAX81_08505 [Candidatus Thorarchaeota archaeon]|nr:hypothetical protein [Candidatus Thorarchaeota archaeon]